MNIIEKLKNANKKTLLSVFGSLIIMAAIPLTVFVVLHTRQLQTPAATTDQPPALSSNKTKFLSNEILIKVKKAVKTKVKEGKPTDTGLQSLNNLNQQEGAQKFEKVAQSGAVLSTSSEISSWYKVSLSGKSEILEEDSSKVGKKSSNLPSEDKIQNLRGEIDKYKKDPNIEVAEPNYIAQAYAVPNDPYYSSAGTWGQFYPDLWGIQKINSQAAWDQTTGSNSVTVAVVDTGVDRTHSDLTNNMWVNQGETGPTTQEGPAPNCTSRGLTLDKSCNNLDEDHNGYVDDNNGWDFTTCASYSIFGCDAPKQPGNDPKDGFGHGTHVAGTIGAVGNNSIGVVGVNWNVKIMAVKGLNDQGSGTMLELANGIIYAVNNGAKVINLSLGCQCDSDVITNAISYAHDAGVVVVVAAGNSNADAINFTPASLQDVITVAATDPNNARATFSNFGSKIDVAAPGVDILSLRAAGTDIYLGSPAYTACGRCVPLGDPNAKYYRASGTSMATPHVAGLAALLLAKNPNLRNEQVRQIIRNSATDLGTVGFDTSFGYGLINAQTAVNYPTVSFVYIKSPLSKSKVSGIVPIIGEISGTNIASYAIKWTDATGDHPIQALATLPTTSGTTLANWDTTRATEGVAKLNLTVTDTNGKNYIFNIDSVTVDNITAMIDSPTKLVAKNVVNVLGSALTTSNATGAGFSKYVVEYGVGTAPTSWVTTGITLTNAGTKPITSSTLGTWDTSSLSAATYTLRLTVTDASNMTDVSSIQVSVDPELVSGWPKLLMNGSDCNWSGANHDTLACQPYPITADFDNDGQKEILVVGPDDYNQTQVQANIFRRDGSLLPGWPITVSGRVQFAPNVADIDKDGFPEIIITTRDGHIFVYDYKGQLKPGWSNVTIAPTIFFGTNYTDEGVAIADINKDGNTELVTVDGNGMLHEFNNLGQELTGFPKQITSDPLVKVRGPVTLADIDGDGFSEVIYSQGSNIYAYNYQGTLLTGWPYKATPSCPIPGTQQNLKTSLAVGDLRKDGKLEIAALGECGDLYLVSPNGTAVTGWPIHDSSLNYSSYGSVAIESYISPIIADINGPKVIFGAMNGIIIADINGLVRKISSLSWVESISAADTNNDGKKELLVSTMTGLYLLDEFGNQIWKRDGMGVFFRSGSGVVDDLNGDGQLELVAASEGLYNSYLFVWQPAFSSNTNEVWTMVQHDSTRGGTCLSCAPTVSLTSPTNGSTVDSTVNLSANASGSRGVSKVEFWIDGKLQGYDITSPYTFSWDTTKIANGSHTVKVKAYDQAGDNAVSSATVTVYNRNYVYWVHIAGQFESGCCGTINPTSPTTAKSYRFTLQKPPDPRGYEGVVCSPICNGASTIVWSSKVQFYPSLPGGVLILTPTGQDPDNDHDGFSNVVEQYVGTNPNLVCGFNAWAPDFDNDGVVSSLDLARISAHYNTKVGSANYDRRVDLNADGSINLADLVLASNYYGRRCGS